MKLFYEYMVIFFNLSPTSSHLHPLQVENCDSNSRLVVDEGDNGKFRTERVKPWAPELFISIYRSCKAAIANAYFSSFEAASNEEKISIPQTNWSILITCYLMWYCLKPYIYILSCGSSQFQFLCFYEKPIPIRFQFLKKPIPYQLHPRIKYLIHRTALL